MALHRAGAGWRREKWVGGGGQIGGRRATHGEVKKEEEEEEVYRWPTRIDGTAAFRGR